MKVLREIYAFVTGGSIASPVGLAAAIAIALLCARYLGPQSAGLALLTVLALTLLASVLEAAR